MAAVERIRQEVTEYHIAHAVGDRPADAFAAWWLTRRFDVAPIDAVKRAPGGAHGFGLDGFFLETGPKPVLHLLQARFAGNRTAIRQGFEGFAKCVEAMADLLARRVAPSPDGVLGRLALALEQHAALVPKLALHFRILHMCDDDSASLEQYLRPALKAFTDAAGLHLPDHTVRAIYVSPAMELSYGAATQNPPEAYAIRFKGQDLQSGNGAGYFTGVGYLADLVKLYAASGEGLFAKNVRFYMHRNARSGPARYIRETLAAICVEQSVPPEQFAMLHNGVTLHASSARPAADSLQLRGPSVLNGCQTIVSAARFFEDKQQRPKINVSRWKLVPIPLRIITTSSEALVRLIAVSNNRQVAVRASAFRANDPEQLRLAARFAEMGIYYERQEGAFENLRAANAVRFLGEYGNSYDRPLRMEDLAQAIAVVSDQWALSTAMKSDLFADPMYRQIFSGTHTANLRLLVFLVNLHLAMPLVLRDLRKKSAVFADLPIGRFRLLAVKILAKYIGMHEPQLISDSWFGTEVAGRMGPEHPLRVRLRQITAAQNSGLQQALPKYWLESGRWKDPATQAAITEALKELRLEHAAVFKLYADAAAAGLPVATP